MHISRKSIGIPEVEQEPVRNGETHLHRYWNNARGTKHGASHTYRPPPSFARVGKRKENASPARARTRAVYYVTTRTVADRMKKKYICTNIKQNKTNTPLKDCQPWPTYTHRLAHRENGKWSAVSSSLWARRTSQPASQQAMSQQKSAERAWRGAQYCTIQHHNR